MAVKEILEKQEKEQIEKTISNSLM